MNNSKRFRVKDKDRGEEYSEAEDDFDDDKHYYSLANLTEEDDIWRLFEDLWRLGWMGAEIIGYGNVIQIS